MLFPPQLYCLHFLSQVLILTDSLNVILNQVIFVQLHFLLMFLQLQV